MSLLSLPLEQHTVTLLQTYGSLSITSARIASTPIIINEIPTPALHVYLILDLENVSLIMEKNNRVEISLYTPCPLETSTSLSMTPCLLSTFLHNGIMAYQDASLPTGEGLQHFWSMYHVETNNCQQFVFRMLRANQWSTHGLEQYNQGAEQIKSNLHQQAVTKKTHPLSSLVSKLITHTLVESIMTYSTNLVRQNQTSLPDSDLVTMDGIHFHSYPNCTPLEACQREEEWYYSEPF
jgi:hypothetical protein